jgi:hypothetical protein
MAPTTTPARRTRPHIAIALILLIALLPALPARAIMGVSGTDNGHPYVGGSWRIVGDCNFDGTVEAGECDHPDEINASGILVAENVVLTSAERWINGRRVAVSFASPIIDPSGDADDLTDYYDPVTNPDGIIHLGYAFHHPDFGGFGAFPGSYSHENNHDTAVIILDFPVPDIAPASVASIGALDESKGGGRKPPLTAVGYGSTTNNFKEATFDFARHAAGWELTGLKPFYAHTKASGQHGPCDGDQGGPILAGNTEAVAALMVNWDGICNAKGVGLGYRVDTAEAHDFLCFVSDADLDAEQIANPNKPVIGGDVIDYPDVTPASSAVLDNYCDSGVQKAAADESGQQAADRQHKQAGKQGGKHRGKGKHRK